MQAEPRSFSIFCGTVVLLCITFAVYTAVAHSKIAVIDNGFVGLMLIFAIYKLRLLLPDRTRRTGPGGERSSRSRTSASSGGSRSTCPRTSRKSSRCTPRSGARTSRTWSPRLWANV